MKKPITVRLYPMLDLPMPTPANKHRALVIFDKSEDSLSRTNSGSTSTMPNPKRVKYKVTGRQLPSGRYEKVLIRPDSSDAKAMDG